MMMKYLFFSGVLLVFACQPSNTNEAAQTEDNEAVGLVDSAEVEEVATSQRPISEPQSFNYNHYEIQLFQEAGKIIVDAKTPAGEQLAQTNIEASGQLMQAELLDMNKDDRPELAVITKAKNGAERLEVYSFTPRSSLPVYIDETDLTADQHYEISNGRIYSTYNDNGQQKRVSYNLVAGEASYRLEPHGMTPQEMEVKVYGEFASDPYPNTYHQNMTIRDNGLGEIVVNFKASAAKNGEADCEFEVIGNLVDGTIRVPLSRFGIRTNGVVLLQQMTDGWEVLADSPKQQTMVNDLCQGGATILGKYKRVRK